MYQQVIKIIQQTFMNMMVYNVLNLHGVYPVAVDGAGDVYQPPYLRLAELELLVVCRDLC